MTRQAEVRTAVVRRLIVLAVSGLAIGVAEVASAQTLTMGGQFRPRYETRAPSPSAQREAFGSMRSRIHLSALLERDVRVFLQVQDVRIWGEEASPLGDFTADGLDLHQGYVEVGLGTDRRTYLRVGRQEIRLGGERLVGVVDWAQQAQAFDGIRATTGQSWGEATLFGFQLRERAVDTSDQSASFLGGHAAFDISAVGTVGVYGLYDRARGETRSDQGTFGVRWVGGWSEWSHRVDAYYQTGTRSERDVSAYLIGARLGRSFANGAADATLWYDYLSGGDGTGSATDRSFHTLFATNHKYYGHADLFLNIPAHTAGRGLQDLAVKLAFAPTDETRLGMDVHTFHLARDAGLDSGRLGEEIDLTARYRYTSNVVVTAGLSRVFQRDAWAEIGRLDRDLSFAYIMLDVQF